MHSFYIPQVTVHAIAIKIYQLVVYSLGCKLNNAISGFACYKETQYVCDGGTGLLDAGCT